MFLQTTAQACQLSSPHAISFPRFLSRYKTNRTNSGGTWLLFLLVHPFGKCFEPGRIGPMISAAGPVLRCRKSHWPHLKVLAIILSPKRIAEHYEESVHVLHVRGGIQMWWKMAILRIDLFNLVVRRESRNIWHRVEVASAILRLRRAQ